MLIYTLAGAVLGTICKITSSRLSDLLLKKRGRDYSESRKESILLFLVSAIFGGAIGYLVPISAESVYLFLLLIVVESVAVIDMHFRIIPNELSLAVMILTAAFGIPGMLGVKGFPEFNIKRSLLGLATCFLIFLLPTLFSKCVGAGDVKLAAAMGFCLGFWNSLFGIVLMGALVLCYIFMQFKLPALKVLKTFIPMGPFLAASMIAISLLVKLPAVSIYLTDLPF